MRRKSRKLYNIVEYFIETDNNVEYLILIMTIGVKASISKFNYWKSVEINVNELKILCEGIEEKKTAE